MQNENENNENLSVEDNSTENSKPVDICLVIDPITQDNLSSI